MTPQVDVIRGISDFPPFSGLDHVDVPREIHRTFPCLKYGFAGFRIHDIGLAGVRAGLDRDDSQIVLFLCVRGSRDANNCGSGLDLSMLAIIVKLIHVHLLGLSRGDVFQGLRIGVKAAEHLIRDAEVIRSRCLLLRVAPG